MYRKRAEIERIVGRREANSDGSPRNEYPDEHAPFFGAFQIDRDYYECHEVMEELWLEEGGDPFHQGLLQVAVGLFHFRRENINGARKLVCIGPVQAQAVLRSATWGSISAASARTWKRI